MLIISPQPWGTMRISKHHYALECARHARKVFFLNPPEPYSDPGVSVRPSGVVENLFVVRYRQRWFFRVRFHARRLFDWFLAGEIRRIREAIDEAIDVVWCFDFNLYSDLGKWRAGRRIYHPVDPVAFAYQLRPAQTADLLISNDDSTLVSFAAVDTPKLLLNHGVAAPFVQSAEQEETTERSPGEVRFGYVGNLLRHGIATEALRRVITDHPEIAFHFWGTYQEDREGGLGNENPESSEFIEFLKGRSNVRLRGPKETSDLAIGMREMDGFFFCYDPPSHAPNPHKVLEFFSTGKVVVCSHVRRYADQPELIRMTDSADPAAFSQLFGETIANLKHYNGPALQTARRQLAIDNSYERQLLRIDETLQNAPRHSTT